MCLNGTKRQNAIALFPFSKRVRAPAACANAGCAICADYNLRLDQCDGSPGSSPPVWTTRLHTSVSPGPNNVRSEHVVFPRPAQPEDRFDYRKSVADAFAAVLNKILAEGKMPEGATANRTITIPKVPKPGVTINRADPADARPITIGDTVPKVFGLVMQARLSHHCILHGLVGKTQAGFMPMMGTEWHVFTLTEAIKDKWRHNEPVYALFVDIKNAFPSVHPEALWAVLRAMGIPDKIVSILARWNSQRTTSISVNGESSPPFSMSLGLSQGDILSPLLFNMCIEPLSNYLGSLPNYKGITAAGVTILDLKYADDLSALCKSQAELKYVLHSLNVWCSAWGLTLSVGKKKTEAMAFPAPTSRRAKNQPASAEVLEQLTITIDGSPKTVEWTNEYKYLGCAIRSDLGEGDGIKNLAEKIRGQWTRYFEANRHVRSASPAFALQIFRTVVLGAGNYLLSLTKPDAAALRALDSASSRAARASLHLKENGNEATMWADSGLPVAASTFARERVRLFMQLQLTPYKDGIAPRLLRGLLDQLEAPRPKGVRSTPRSWASTTMSIIRANAAMHGVHLVFPQHYGSVTETAAIYGRAVGRSYWAKRSLQLATRAATTNKTPQPAPVTIDARPPSTSSALSFYFNSPVGSGPHVLGTKKGSTPLSVRGPGCSAGVIALCTDWIPADVKCALGRLRKGRPGLFMAPLAPAGTAFSDLHSSWHEMANKNEPCSRCFAHHPDAVIEDPYHVLVECQHPDVANERHKMLLAFPDKLHAIVRLALRAAVPIRFGVHDPALLMDADARAAQIRELAQSTDWSSADGKFVLHHLLAVVTWPASVAAAASTTAPEGYPLSLAVGSVWDAVNEKPHKLRAMANLWTSWAGRHVLALHRVWGLAKKLVPDHLA